MFLFTKTKSSKTPYKLLSIEENRFSNIVLIVFIMLFVISVLFSNTSLPFYIKDCIADNTRSIAKMNTYENRAVFTNFFPVLIFSSSPKLNFCIKSPEPTATAAIGVASFISHDSMFWNAFSIVLTSFGVPAHKLIFVNSNISTTDNINIKFIKNVFLVFIIIPPFHLKNMGTFLFLLVLKFYFHLIKNIVN